jgi:pimeloyl-ACP methyl ester carboxylesterase
MTLQDKTTTLDGARVHYLEAGEEHERALLLLHGLGTAQLNWVAAIPTLAAQYHVVAPDLPGFGDSAALPKMRLPALIQWLKTLLESVNVQQAVVVGSSMGGLIARLFAAGEPVYAKGVILVNGGGVPSLPSFLRTIDNLPVIGDFVFGLFGRSATSPNSINQMVHVESVKTADFSQQIGASRKGVAGLIRMLARDPLPASTVPQVPTLLLWGADDKLAPLAEADKIKASIPGSTLSPIADCGHLPQLEAPDVFDWQVLQFLEILSRPPKVKSKGVGMLGQKK